MILVVFLAGYLSENRSLLVEESTRIGPIRLPPLPYLAPMVAMWAIALGIVIVQRDLGAALLFFAVFLLLLYVSTARVSFVVLGLGAFVGAAVLYFLFGHVRTRIDVWLDPFADPVGPASRWSRRSTRSPAAGSIGTRLGAGCRPSADDPDPRAPHRLPVRGPGRGAGPGGILAILGLYLVLVERGLQIASAAQDEFRAILAAGLSW